MVELHSLDHFFYSITASNIPTAFFCCGVIIRRIASASIGLSGLNPGLLHLKQILYLFSCSPVGKNLPAVQEDPGLIRGWGRSPGEGNGNPLQYSCLENSMGREAWRATVRGVAKSRTQLSNQHTLCTSGENDGKDSLAT